MSVLAAEVERGEAAAVPKVVVGLGAAEELRSAAEALPGGLVEGGVAVLENSKTEEHNNHFGIRELSVGSPNILF